MIRIDNYIYSQMCDYSNEWIKRGEIKTNFEGVEFIVWYI